MSTILPRGLYQAMLACVAMAAPCFENSGAMEFSIRNYSSSHPDIEFPPVVVGSGPVVPGDADRLRAIIPKVPRDELGMKWIGFNSDGGSVDAAFEVAKVIDEFGAVTIVPPGASCASACAAILFVAGKVHLVAPGGALGLHTCYKGGPTAIPDQLCNERIAQFALEHGTAYGSVMAFMQYTRPQGMIWFSHDDADCWGLNEYPEGQEPAGYEKCVFESIRRVCEQPGKCRNR